MSEESEMKKGGEYKFWRLADILSLVRSWKANGQAPLGTFVIKTTELVEGRNEREDRASGEGLSN